MGKTSGKESSPAISKVQLAIGAASLFLFIVGVKRTFRMDDAPVEVQTDDGPDASAEPEKGSSGAGGE